MTTPYDIPSVKDGRDHSLLEEQALCRRALESGVYDSMVDRAWVALCEQVATEARQLPERGTDAALTGKHATHRSEKYTPKF